MNKKRSFTMIELLVVIIIIAILASIAIPVYQYQVEKQKIDICTAHLEGILEALKIYGQKYDHVPSSLSKAWHEFGEEALAVVWERKKKEKDYFYLAYMSTLRARYILATISYLNIGVTLQAPPPESEQLPSFSQFLADTSMLKCPADDTPYDGKGNISYGINAALEAKTWAEAKATSLDFVVGDSNLAQISSKDELNKCHKKGFFGTKKGAVFIKPQGEVTYKTQYEEEKLEEGKGEGDTIEIKKTSDYTDQDLLNLLP